MRTPRHLRSIPLIMLALTLGLGSAGRLAAQTTSDQSIVGLEEARGRSVAQASGIVREIPAERVTGENVGVTRRFVRGHAARGQPLARTGHGLADDHAAFSPPVASFSFSVLK